MSKKVIIIIVAVVVLAVAAFCIIRFANKKDNITTDNFGSGSSGGGNSGKSYDNQTFKYGSRTVTVFKQETVKKFQEYFKNYNDETRNIVGSVDGIIGTKFQQCVDIIYDKVGDTQLITVLLSYGGINPDEYSVNPTF